MLEKSSILTGYVGGKVEIVITVKLIILYKRKRVIRSFFDSIGTLYINKSDGILIGLCSFLAILAVLYDNADQVVSKAIGTYYYKNIEIVNPLITYGIIMLVVMVLNSGLKKNREREQVALRYLLLLVLVGVFSAFCYIVRSGK